MAYLSFTVFLLYLSLVFPVSRCLKPRFLEIRSGVLRWRIGYKEIRAARSVRNALAAPSLSFDRLEILYGTAGRALISPRDREAFLTDLDARALQLGLPLVPDLER